MGRGAFEVLDLALESGNAGCVPLDVAGMQHLAGKPSLLPQGCSDVPVGLPQRFEVALTPCRGRLLYS